MTITFDNANDFLKYVLKKNASSIHTIAQFLNGSIECETASKNPAPDSAHRDGVYNPDFRTNVVARLLNEVGGGLNYNPATNSGNGWNADCHQDGTVRYNDSGVQAKGYNDVETSSAPFKNKQFSALRDEIKQLYQYMEHGTGGMLHSAFASTHNHITSDFIKINGEYVTALQGLPFLAIYRNIAMFMLKYMDIMKWVSMTATKGARGAHGNTYDTLENDRLFSWYEAYGQRFKSRDAKQALLNIPHRTSYVRIHGRENSLHWENRMLDQSASHTHIAAWVTLNKAITLWAIDFAKNDFFLDLSAAEVEAVQYNMRRFRRGQWESIEREYIQDRYEDMMSILGKYFDILGSLDAVEYIDKLIETPIPAYLNKNNVKDNYNPFIQEKAFNLRKRESNEELREQYMQAVKGMKVKRADSLDEFNKNIAAYLGVTETQTKSLYQMLKKKRVKLEWLLGRLQYMGE